MGQLIRNGVSSISLAARGAEGGRALEVGDAPPPCGGCQGEGTCIGDALWETCMSPCRGVWGRN